MAFDRLYLEGRDPRPLSLREQVACRRWRARLFGEHPTFPREIFQGEPAFQGVSRSGVPNRGYEGPFHLILRLARPLRLLSLVQRAASGDTEEIAMERMLVDGGHRVETQPESGLVCDITHAAPGSGAVGRIVGADAKGRDALQAALKKAAAAVGNGIQDRRDEAIAYARREPVAALTAAAGFGFLVGLALAIGSRAGTGGGRAWLHQLNLRRAESHAAGSEMVE